MIQGTGIFGTPITALARLIAASGNFQQWVLADERQALARIVGPQADDREESQLPRPRAIMQWGGFEGSVRGAALQSETGHLVLSFEAEPDANLRNPANPKFLTTDQWVDFCNRFGAVLQDMREKSGLNLTDGSGTYLNLRRLVLIDGPSPSVPDEEGGDFFLGVSFLVDWHG